MNAVRGDVLIERHLIGAMTPAPETVTVSRLVHRDPVDPRAEARLASEAMHGSKDAKEDFLGEVEGFVAIAQQVHRELDHHPLVFADEFGAGQFVAGGTALHKRRFAAADIRPTSNPRLLHREFHYTNFRPRAGPKVPTGW